MRRLQAMVASQSADVGENAGQGPHTCHSTVVKPEPVENEQKPFALPQTIDNGDPRVLRTALDEMRNVSSPESVHKGVFHMVPVHNSRQNLARRQG